MSKKCELCEGEAKTYCESDRARLCWECDGKVHGANFLVAKHSRSLLCRLCHSPTPWTAAGPSLSPTVSMCRSCFQSCCQSSQSQGQHQQQQHDHDNDNDYDDHDGHRADEHDHDHNDDDEDNCSEDDDDDDDDDDEEENQVVPWSNPQPPHHHHHQQASFSSVSYSSRGGFW